MVYKSYKELNTPATEPQINLLKKNNIVIPAGLTKIEASKLISVLKATIPQIKLLEKNRIVIPEGLTMTEASKLIEGLFKK